MDESELKRIEDLCNAATNGPWVSFAEGRDHQSGSDFIRTGGPDSGPADIELIGVTIADQDFIAEARQAVPNLIEEIRNLNKKIAMMERGPDNA